MASVPDGPPIQIDGIHIRNYRCLRDVKFDAMPSFSVFVGPNGSGKSTLFDALALVKESLADGVPAALARRGGYGDALSRGEDGPIEIEIALRKLDARVATLRLEANANGGCVEIEGRYQSEVRDAVSDWHMSDIRLDKARESAGAGPCHRLSPSGDNLAQVARHIYEKHEWEFRYIHKRMLWSVPGLRGVEVKSDAEGEPVIYFYQYDFDEPFTARQVSDGTLKLFAHLTLLEDPKNRSLVVVEEPETNVFYDPQGLFVEYFSGYARSRSRQVFLSTHSPELLHAVMLEDIYYLTSKDGFTSVFRPHDSETLRAFTRGGDPPGVFLRQGLFKAMPL